MKIGFLIIGSEVLDGKISDLNTRLLAEFLRANHLEISMSMVARDEKEALFTALRELFTHNDLIITSGGLGPTKDDITKEVLAEFLGREITYNEKSFEVAKDNYERMSRTFPGKEHGYCFLPENFEPLKNSTGFAPGFFTRHEEKILFSGPGVPREFKSMLHDHLLGILKGKIDTSVYIDNVIVRTRGVPEEKIFGEVDTSLWDKLESFGDVSSLPILMGVDIGVKIKASSESELQKKKLEVEKIFKSSPVHPHIWNFGPGSLEERIVEIANRKKIKFGFAESATGGLCSHRITSVSGSSQSFMGSVICYDESVKENILGVSPRTLKEHSAVSLECAREMSQGLKKLLHLDIAISITGFAGPTGGNEKYPVGSVCIGRSTPGGDLSAQSLVLKGDRGVLKERFSQAALYALLEELENFA